MMPSFPPPTGMGELITNLDMNTLHPTTEKEKDIVTKLFQKVPPVNQDYLSSYSEYLKLIHINATLRKKLKYNDLPTFPKDVEVQHPLTEEDDENISTGVEGEVIRNFAHTLFEAMKKVTHCQVINRAISEENLKLQNSALPEIPYTSQSSLYTNTLDEKKEPAALPSPPKVLTLHPSEQQKQQEALQKQQKPANNQPVGDQWKQNLFNALERYKKEILESYPLYANPATWRKEILFVDFLNRYVEHPKTFISSFPIMESDVKTINIAIEFLGGREKRITADDLK
jgi:hypothetical protein